MVSRKKGRPGEWRGSRDGRRREFWIGDRRLVVVRFDPLAEGRCHGEITGYDIRLDLAGLKIGGDGPMRPSWQGLSRALSELFEVE